MEEIFYILIKNRKFLRENQNDDFHIERIFSVNDIINIIEFEVFNFEIGDIYVVTNDEKLLAKYFVTINIDDFKMLCKIDFDHKKLRISERKYHLFNEEIYRYFQKIRNEDIISACMNWKFKAIYPYDDQTVGVNIEIFDCWKENTYFEYFKTPARYKINQEENEIFNLPVVEEVSIIQLEKLINVNILEIGTDEFPNLNWEWRNKMLRYYDRKSSKRFYITQNILRFISINPGVLLTIETKFDKNQYIEYYAKRVKYKDFYINFDFSESENKTTNKDNNLPALGLYAGFYESDLLNEKSPAINVLNERDSQYEVSPYDKYNGAYGYDDNTIDDAFEGDPEFSWNID